RYGRDRRERGERGERQERPTQADAAPQAAEAAPNGETRPAPVAAAPAAVAAPAAATNGRALPRVQSYTLPLSELDQVASASGLQWVKSDADKVAAAQAAIAAEPRPVHVPRERPAPVVIDEGPLILVETRKDLRELKLPFEQQETAQG
ncbi:MAG: ribonuclease E/G, partial [Curvibacter sp.]